jgi:hypothetical protein
VIVPRLRAPTIRTLSSHSFQLRWILFERISPVPIDADEIGVVTDADARALYGGGPDLGRMSGETVRTGHHANLKQVGVVTTCGA